MPKYNTGSQFDEFFMNAYQFQQSLNEKRNQRIQDINFRLRELSLLDDYRQDVETRRQEEFEGKKPLIEAQTDYYKRLAEPKPVKEQKVFLGSDRGGGLITDTYGFERGEDDLILEKRRRNDPTFVSPGTDKTPFYDLTKSGKAFNEYKGLTGSNLKSTGDEDFEVITEKGNVEFISCILVARFSSKLCWNW